MVIKRNLHSIDIAIRIASGLALIYVGLIDANVVENSTLRIVFGVFGVINIVVALMRSCPLYSLAGISTFCDESGNDN